MITMVDHGEFQERRLGWAVPHQRVLAEMGAFVYFCHLLIIIIIINAVKEGHNGSGPKPQTQRPCAL